MKNIKTLILAATFVFGACEVYAAEESKTASVPPMPTKTDSGRLSPTAVSSDLETVANKLVSFEKIMEESSSTISDFQKSEVRLKKELEAAQDSLGTANEKITEMQKEAEELRRTRLVDQEKVSELLGDGYTGPRTALAVARHFMGQRAEARKILAEEVDSCGNPVDLARLVNSTLGVSNVRRGALVKANEEKKSLKEQIEELQKAAPEVRTVEVEKIVEKTVEVEKKVRVRKFVQLWGKNPDGYVNRAATNLYLAGRNPVVWGAGLCAALRALQRSGQS